MSSIKAAIQTHKAKAFLVICVFIIGCWTSANAQFYYGLQNEFGKNRMKYETFFWTYYAYENYDVYFYEEGRELANYVSRVAKEEIKKAEKLFDYPLEDRFQFVIFNKHSDFKQSNIGYAVDEQYNIGGVTRIVGSKVILYYEGDHDKLDAQIRAGIAQIIIDEMLYGGNVRQMVRNNSTLSLPEWYIKGLVAYVANDWNAEIDNYVKDAIINNKYDKINYLESNDAVYAGLAFWKHITNNYGESVIPNILYMTKVTHNIDNATLYVLGLPINSLWDECLQTFRDRYRSNDSTQTLPKQAPVLSKPKKTRVYSQVKLSPNGNSLVYTTNELGQYKVWIYDMNTHKSKRVYKAGHKMDRLNDYSYPLVAWHPSSNLFSFIIERKGFIVMKYYDLETGKLTERNITGFEKILDYSYDDEGKKIAMSAVKKGQTDIYIFTAASSAYYQITNDIYDDLTPRFINHSKGVVFTSNRPNDTLSNNPKVKLPERQNNMDVFVFNNETKSKKLLRITNTPAFNETYPTDYDSVHITYLSDMNGIRNRFIAHIDSTIAFIDTTVHYRPMINAYPVSNYSRSILEQDINSKSNMLTELLFIDGKYRMYYQKLVPVDSLNQLELKNTSYRNHRLEVEKRDAEKSKENQTAVIPEINVQSIEKETPMYDTSAVDIDHYVFEDEEKKAQPIEVPNHQTTDTLNSKKGDAIGFVLGKQTNYYTNFTVDYVVSQLDNTFLNNNYQKFSGGNNPLYLNPGINAFFKVSISDLFEDYRIAGGARFSGDLRNNEYFISFEDRMNNLDKQLVLHRQKLFNTSDNNSKIYTHDARYSVRLPFSEVSSLRGSVTYRNNRFVYLAVNDNFLAKPDSFENWGSTLVEYIYDNSRKRGLNLYYGTRAKIFGEYYRQIDKKETDFFVFGCDLRYYQKIHRNFIWANRFAASTSVGNQKLIYYLGGVDNWFLPQFDRTTNISKTENYAYQTLATNMRGFYQNIRNGNSFAVINSELRLPVFNYFFKRNFSSDFIKNFQVIGFGDIGTAWVGKTPNSNNEPYNTITAGSKYVVVYLYRRHDPIVGGYGWGVRSRLWGYFIRIDRAWGVQDGIIAKPITYISLSLDF